MRTIDVVCPRCHASPGEHCKLPSGRRTLTLHQDRCRSVPLGSQPPTRRELLAALYKLVEYSTGCGEPREGNPYSKAAVRRACALLAAAKGSSDPLDWNK